MGKKKRSKGEVKERKGKGKVVDIPPFHQWVAIVIEKEGAERKVEEG